MTIKEWLKIADELTEECEKYRKSNSYLSDKDLPPKLHKRVASHRTKAQSLTNENKVLGRAHRLLDEPS